MEQVLTQSHGDLRSDFFRATTKDVKATLNSSRIQAKKLRRRLKEIKASEETQDGKVVQLTQMPDLQDLRYRMNVLKDTGKRSMSDSENSINADLIEIEQELDDTMKTDQRLHGGSLAVEDDTDDAENVMNKILSAQSSDEIRPAASAALGLSNRVKGGRNNKLRGAMDISDVVTSAKRASQPIKKKSLAQIKNDVAKMTKKLAKLKIGENIEQSATVADVCYYCKKPGHWKIHCPDLAQYTKVQDSEKRDKLQGLEVLATAASPFDVEIAAGMIENYPDTPWGRGMATREKTTVTVSKRLPGVPHHTDQCYYCEKVGHWKGEYWQCNFICPSLHLPSVC